MFPPMLVGALMSGAASALSLLHHYRQMLGPMSLREARLLANMEPTPIAEATKQDALVKIVGTVGCSEPFSSYYHHVPCAVLELHSYELVDSVGGVRRVLLHSERRASKFWIEDETGRVPIDPEHARLDLEIEGNDLESAMEEHRIRVGERVAVLGRLKRCEPRLHMPMRGVSDESEHTHAFVDRPLVTWRSEPEVFPRLRPPANGLALSAGSVGLALLGSILNV